MSDKITRQLGALFPGQGSQSVGMIKSLVDNFSWTKQIFEEASDALKDDLLKLCLEGPEETLQLTRNAQPAILTTSYAWFQVLVRNLDFKPRIAAGHSLGEYSALLAAGAVKFADAVRLVRKRGDLMQTAVPEGKGKMAAILGLEDEKVLQLCRLATEGENSLVVPANFNAPNQVVIAGHAAAVERAEVIASGERYPELKARKFIPLKVSAPFHCPLMNKVATEFQPYLSATEWNARIFPVCHNLDAAIRTDGDLVSLLSQQIDHSVQWTKSIQTMEQNGYRYFVEMGPGKVLAGLCKRILKDGAVISLDSVDDFKSLEKKFQEEA